MCVSLKELQLYLGCMQTDATTRNIVAQQCWSYCVYVDSGVQTDATTSNIVGTYSASWEDTTHKSL